MSSAHLLRPLGTGDTPNTESEQTMTTRAPAQPVLHRHGCTVDPPPRIEPLPDGGSGYARCLECGGSSRPEPRVTGALANYAGVSTDDLMRPAPQPVQS
jgi:hypothetical protein